MTDDPTGSQIEAWAANELDIARRESARWAGHVHDNAELVNQVISLNLEQHHTYPFPDGVLAECPDESTRALVASLIQRAASMPHPQEQP